MEREVIIEHLFEEKRGGYYLFRLSQRPKEFALEFRLGLTKGEWRRVIAHQLVVAEACDTLAEALGLASSEREDLYLAARVHDIDKKIEIENRAWSDEDQRKQYKIKESILINAGYPEGIIALSKATGWDSLPKFLNTNTSLKEQVIHYIDDIVTENKIVPLRQRILNSLKKPHVKILSKDGMNLYGGKSFSRVAYKVSSLIEAKFAEKIGLKDPTCLPDYINKKIEERIANFSKK